MLHVVKLLVERQRHITYVKLKGNKSQCFDHMGLTELIKITTSSNNHIFNVSCLQGNKSRTHSHRMSIDYVIFETKWCS